MSQNAAFETQRNVMPCATLSLLWSTTLVTTTVLAILATQLHSTAAVPTKGETSSQRSDQVLPLCPAGTHLEPTRQLECLPCPSGVSFTSTVNRRTECLECLSCRGLIVESPCNATHNTVCRCPPGHYLNVDGGCTILGSGNGRDSSEKSHLALSAAVSHNEVVRSCEKESILTDVHTALLVIAVAGIIALITMTVISNNVNWRCLKWSSRSRGRLPHSKKQDHDQDQDTQLLHQRDGLSGLSNGMQTDGPINAHRDARCCAEVQARFENEAADHVRTKEKLEATEKHLASYQQSPAVGVAAFEKFRQEVTSNLELVRAAIVERHQENSTISTGTAGNEHQARGLDHLKRRIKRIAQQSDAAYVASVILKEIEAFSNNPSEYAQASPMEAEDQEAGSSHS